MPPRFRSVSTAVGVVLLFALPLLPEILGSRLLVFRDAELTHWPWHRVAMAALQTGRVPFLNEAASGTQPLLANPNAVLLYPTVLLERVLPAPSAFNLHYLLHILWAFFGARLLASRLGVSPGGALFSGAAYAFSGMMLSYGSAFFNSIAAAAWLPWCAAAALGVSRAAGSREVLRAAAATGLAFALQLLAGEPAISLLTGAFVAFLVLLDFAAAPGPSPLRRGGRLVAGGLGAAVVALTFAAALLLPLRAVFPMTYRGQHLYSESAFGAAPFLLWRTIEWLFPRFGGDPATLGSGASWMHSVHEQDLVYIWCVSFGVLPLIAVFCGALRREFWDRRTAGLASAAIVTWLLSLGFALPLYRVVFAIGFLRRLRYPIKFYLLTTIAVALLAGFAADRFRAGRLQRRHAVFLGALLVVYAAAFASTGPGGWLDAALTPRLIEGSLARPDMLDAFRASIRGDAVFGAIAIVLLAAILRAKRMSRPGFLLALLGTALALPWGLPLFVSASVKDMRRPPAIRSAMHGPGRLFASPEMPTPDFDALQPGRRGLPRFEKVARALAEQLIPATGQAFGIAYVFDHDSDGSYGWYNRVASEAAAASGPVERSRLLRAYGARWALAAEGEAFPLFHPVTGVVVAGRHLLLHALDDPVADLRWAGRVHSRASLSSAIELIRSDRFHPDTDVVLPGRVNRDASAPAAPAAALSLSELSPERAAGTVESATPGHVVFARTYFPAWRARLDGAPVRVLVANARDLAIAVPAGRHTFEFAWDRKPFHTGVIAQAAAFLLVLGVAIGTGRETGK
jgi:hypothetical protein